MTIEERKDLFLMQNEVVNIKIRAFDYMEFCLSMTPEALSQSGYKSIDEAIVATIKREAANVKKALAAHVRKWPD